MAIIDDILGSLTVDAPVREIRIGARASALLSRRLGLAFLYPLAAGAAGAPPPERRESAREIALLARSDEPSAASLGLAAINSLIDPGEEAIEEGNGLSLLTRLGAGKDVTLVGHFPFVDQLRPLTRNLWVLELVPSGSDLPASEAPRVIPRSQVVAITGASLVNHSLDGLLALARGREILLLGPSAPLSPILLELGFSAVCGALVTDERAVMRSVDEGVSFRKTRGIRKVILRRR